MESNTSMKLVLLLLVATIAWLGVPTSATTSGTPPTCLADISTSCNITDDGDSTAQLNKCCTSLNDAIDNDRTCFCLLKPYLEDDNSTEAVTTLFTYCKIKGSFDTLCPTNDGASPAPSTIPSGDDSTGDVADGSAPTPTSVPASDDTPSGTPPSCLEDISTSCNITGDGDTAQLNKCCKSLNDAIDNELTCFCSLKPYLDDGSSTDDVSSIFKYCKINDSFDTLCSTDASTTPTPSSSSSTSPSGTGTGTGTGGTAFGKKNAGNKTAMASFSSLSVVVFISLILMKGI